MKNKAVIVIVLMLLAGFVGYVKYDIDREIQRGKAILFNRSNNEPTPSLIPAHKVKSGQTVKVVANTISCTGPDGKVFQTTQEKCDEFNSAWGTNQDDSPQPAQNDDLSTSGFMCPGAYYDCVIRGTVEKWFGCTMEEAIQTCSDVQTSTSCLDGKVKIRYLCEDSCFYQFREDELACKMAYTSWHGTPLIEDNKSLLDECLDQALEEERVCKEICYNSYLSDKQSCEQY